MTDINECKFLPRSAVQAQHYSWSKQSLSRDLYESFQPFQYGHTDEYNQTCWAGSQNLLYAEPVEEWKKGIDEYKPT